MPTVTGPAFSIDAKGDLKKILTFQKKGKGHVVYPFSKPGAREPFTPSPAQEQQREKVARIVQDWQNLTEEEKVEWNDYAEEAGYHGTGYHFYLHKYAVAPEEPAVAGYRVKITIKSENVSEDLEGFPVYVDLADMPAGFWGNVIDGEDIRVTEADGETEVPREVVSCDIDSEAGELHFKGDLLAGSDVDFYICYGDPDEGYYDPSDPYGAENVWTGKTYGLIYHLEEGNVSGTGTADAYKDSSSNGNDGKDMVSATGEEGKIEKGVEFDGNDDWIEASPAASIDNIWTGGGVFSLWTKPTAMQSLMRWIAKDDSNGVNGNEWSLLNDAGRLGFEVHHSSARGYWYYEWSDPTDAWHHVVVVYDADDNANVPSLYIDGEKVTWDSEGQPSGTVNDDSDEKLNLGADQSNGSHPYKGNLDEVRLIDGELTDGWVSTEYANQNSPSTFYNVGEEE